MSNILLVGPTNSFFNSVKKEIEIQLFHKVLHMPSFAMVKDVIDGQKGEFALAVVDFNLADSREGEAARYIVSAGIPAIALVSSLKCGIREKVLETGATDYVVKGSLRAVLTLVREVERVLKNGQGKILVAAGDDDARERMRRQLETGRFTVLEAADERGAMEILAGNPDIKAAIVQFRLRGGDGVQLTSRIRAGYDPNALPVIGVMDDGSEGTYAEFLKGGANDVLVNPRGYEELYSRVTRNLEMTEQFFALKRAMDIDFLTGLQNRKSFFSMADKIYQNYKRNNIRMMIMLLDIDRFRDLNGARGHAVGDAVLKDVAVLLKNRMRKADIVCRFGGEEFCMLLTNVKPEEEMNTLEKFRRMVEDAEIVHQGETVRVTASVGASANCGDSLEFMIRRADEMLSQAKNLGRNKTVIDPVRTAPKKLPSGEVPSTSC